MFFHPSTILLHCLPLPSITPATSLYDEENTGVDCANGVFSAYYTGTGTGTAELECTEGEDEINEDWEADGGEDYATRTTECAETEVSVELEKIEAIA